MSSHDLQNIALTLITEGEGILAPDETVPTLTRRFDALGIRSTKQMRSSIQGFHRRQ